ncbi:MAG: peptide chain release factor N(5)-glutamine methyltransferase [Marmoricola sp.]
MSTLRPPARVPELLREATVQLEQAGRPSAGHDARVLLAHALGVSLGALALRDAVAPHVDSAYRTLVRRRAAGEPLQHLTGVAGFRYVELQVGPGVFVPRPETELLAGWAVERAAALADAGGAPVVVDLCTGSGAIALAIATEVPGATVHAVELETDALRWAEHNLAGSGALLHHGDLADALPDLDGAVDVVVCNPPYIPLEAWESVDAEVRDHDPAAALWSGQDGLDAMRALERTAGRLLRPGGWVGAEHADVQGEAAPAVFARTGRWRDISDHADLAGRPRFLVARLAR